MINVFRPLFTSQSETQAPVPIINETVYNQTTIYEEDDNDDHFVLLGGRYCSKYLTSENLNRDVSVKPIHSHNDYWRYAPLTEALRAGAQSIEADIWYFPENYTLQATAVETAEETEGRKEDPESNPLRLKSFNDSSIYVGHNQIFLEPENTLDKLYFDKLFEILSYSNPEMKYVDTTKEALPLLEETKSKFGVFYNSPETPLYLWLDFKTDANETYKVLQKSLQRFIENDYLAYYDTTTQTYHEGPIILTITGNVPWGLIEQETKRYVFVDVPLADFGKPDIDDRVLQRYAQLGKVASGSMEDIIGKENFLKNSRLEKFNEDAANKLQQVFDKIHAYGLKSRIWGDADFPTYIKEGHWKNLYELGSDFLNTDDVYDVAYL